LSVLRLKWQRVAAVSRTTTKPILDTFRAQGVEIRTADIDNDSVQSLTSLLRGVDILVSAARSNEFTVELRLFDAAKAAGVSRVVPNEWGSYAPEGVLLIHDRVRTSSGVEGRRATLIFDLIETSSAGAHS
jgi:hypothetical protein